jgi:hypothetical protein
MFETQSDNIDDIFGEGETDSEMIFDSKDLDRLNMLERYRYIYIDIHIYIYILYLHRYEYFCIPIYVCMYTV